VAILAHDTIQAPGGDPQRYALFVHGILGTKANWRGIARQFVKARPDWGALTVDLPMHGDSQGFAPPWTVAGCGESLFELVESLDHPTHLALGHSFGGKVVTDLADRLYYSGDEDARLRQLWIIDSPPWLSDDPAASDTHGVITKLRTLPRTFASRQDFGREVTQRGLSQAIATWLAMNLRRVDGHFVFPLKLEAIEALLLSYFQTDAWGPLERLSEELELRFVVGEVSTVFMDEERAELDAWAAGGRIGLEVVEDAGHWLHAERPDVVIEALLAATAD
jgi:pimeloyl-ACP methyl ester carboxylesterase